MALFRSFLLKSGCKNGEPQSSKSVHYIGIGVFAFSMEWTFLEISPYRHFRSAIKAIPFHWQRTPLLALPLPLPANFINATKSIV